MSRDERRDRSGEGEATPEKERKGLIARMAKNAVAANVLMALVIIGGLLIASRIQQEVFPEVTLDAVQVQVAYPGASPDEIEEGLVLAIEEAVRGVDGVDEVQSTAREGTANVVAKLDTGADQDQALDDIKSAVDRITSLPEDAERPIISLATNRRQVISLILYGPVDRTALRHLSEKTRAELLANDQITQLEVVGLPPPEISVEVSRAMLRRHGLSLPQIAQRVSDASIDLPAGGVETPSGEVLVRTTEKKETEDELGRVALVSDLGSRLMLGEVAEIVDGFRDTEERARYDGQPAVRLDVYRVGDQRPQDVAAAVKDYVARVKDDLPRGVKIATWNDRSRIYRDRIDLLLSNAYLGVALVIFILGLFLEIRLAFWVTLGIPLSFLGALWLMPLLGVSLNMISLFAFILTLGIVVDDAIVVGEAIHRQRVAGKPPLRAAIDGAKEVLAPIIFAVLTTVLAFLPLLFIPGVLGKFFDNIPLVVIPILLLSLLESFFILPAHLAHSKSGQDEGGGILGRVRRWQGKFSDLVERGTERFVRPFVEGVVKRRYLTLACALATLIVSGAFVAGGRIKFRFLPDIEGDIATAQLKMPFGTAVEDTRELMDALVETGKAVGDEVGRGSLVEGIYAQLGTLGARGGPNPGASPTGGHVAVVQGQLLPANDREVGTSDFVDAWRQKMGDRPGIESLTFEYRTGPPAGAPVALELSHRDMSVLRGAAEDLAVRLGDYAGVTDIDDGFQRGKPQLDLTLLPGARQLGVDEASLAAQVRAAFFGAEARRQQRGRHELRIYVRLPENERRSIDDVASYRVRTPGGGEIPLRQAAEVEVGRSFTAIERRDGRRVVTVTSDVDSSVTSAGEVIASVRRDVLPELVDRYPGLTFEVAGEQEERAESLGALARGMGLALIAMFVLMAIAFESYLQPILVLVAIPFGFVGALVGHLLLGFDLSIISMLGLVALSGVVVNDSLVLIAAVNGYRDEGQPVSEAVVSGALRRFRPILLTSLTTFFGLSPMIFETSIQARFLIPMALSLGFGVLFVTLVALAVVPALYMGLEDVKGWFKRLFGKPDERSETLPGDQAAT